MWWRGIVTRLIVADRCEIMRAGLAAILLKAGNTVVADCCTVPEVLNALQTHQSDLALIGENVAGQSTAAFILQLRRHCASLRVVLLCESYHSSHASELAALHADGLILHAAVSDRLLECVRRVGEGHQWIDPDLLRLLLYAKAHSPVSEMISARELEVASLVTRG